MTAKKSTRKTIYDDRYMPTIMEEYSKKKKGMNV
jgi:hypothetical protein